MMERNNYNRMQSDQNGCFTLLPITIQAHRRQLSDPKQPFGRAQILIHW